MELQKSVKKFQYYVNDCIVSDRCKTIDTQTHMIKMWSFSGIIVEVQTLRSC